MKLGIFTANEAFRSIEKHICVLSDSGEVIASFGPAEDKASHMQAAHYVAVSETLKGVRPVDYAKARKILLACLPVSV